MDNKWLKRWIDMCELVSTWSEDESTKVGAVIIGSGNTILSTGWNGLPRGIKQTDRRINERPYKYKWFEHAERNAIYNAARNGVRLEGSIMVVKWYPCSDCARAIIQSGISYLYTPTPDFDHPRWGKDFKLVEEMLKETKHVDVIYYVE